jgi:hypothetical protein
MNTIKTIVFATTLMTNIFVCAEEKLDQETLNNNLVVDAKQGTIGDMRRWLREGAEPNHRIDQASALRYTLFYRLPENDFNIDRLALLICAGADATEYINKKSFVEGEEPVKHAFVIALNERLKAKGDCEKCEENCRLIFKQLDLYATKKQTSTS